MQKIMKLEQLNALVSKDRLLVCGGFQANRAPMALVEQLAKDSKKKWKIVSLPNPLPLTILLQNGLVEHMHVGFNGVALEPGFMIPAGYRRAIETGEVDFNESDVYEIIQSLRAAAMGLPFLPAPDLEQSDYDAQNDYASLANPFGDGEIVVVPPLEPDIALLHVQKADASGNLDIADPLYDDLLIKASKKVIVSCEHLVDQIAKPTVPGLYVDHVIEIPGGAKPTACLGFYEQNEEEILKILSN